MASPSRELGKRLFTDVTPEFLERERVDQTPMFGSDALRLGGKVFAFIGREGALVVKLSEDRAGDLVESGAATPMRIGRNQAREWVAVPMDPQQDTTLWQRLVEESYAFLASADADSA